MHEGSIAGRVLPGATTWRRFRIVGRQFGSDETELEGVEGWLQKVAVRHERFGAIHLDEYETSTRFAPSGPCHRRVILLEPLTDLQ